MTISKSNNSMSEFQKEREKDKKVELNAKPAEGMEQTKFFVFV